MNAGVSIISLVILSLIVETVWETVKMAVPLKIPDWGDRIGAMCIGLLLAIGTGLDIMVILQIPIHIPYLGLILTGLLISRGSNFMHDILAKVEGMKEIKDAFPSAQQDTGRAVMNKDQADQASDKSL